MTIPLDEKALDEATNAFFAVGSADPAAHVKAGVRAAIEAYLAARRETGFVECGWRPIETAPKDGTWILGWAQGDSAPYRISWGRNHNNRLAWCTSFSSFINGYITRWMPLPTLPLEAASQEQGRG